ncbi:MAG: DNA polymerase III subunit gamma/tau [Candidatus Sericytochromatia bacterium]
MVALYRKFRPQVWEDLVGQEHISKTLINAIETSKLAHAYMFCGSRGTGKTTTARVLAKALNCENRLNGSPCNKCGSCNEISSGSSLDVIEIDAASNRGIGEIKTLIEQVRFASVSGKYKVYIIDEFHMLTTEAFNALLKTLEEPPPKVIFVLATTEAQKILPTIVSRCQRFDFQRISVTAMTNRLKYVAETEKIQISDESILAIARKANGGLRDALSLLDQISSFSLGEGKIPEDIVNQVLGLVSINFLVNLVEAISEKNHLKVLETLDKLSKSGNDPNVIVTETINFFRHLLIVKSAPLSAENLEVPMSNIEIYKNTANLFSSDDILENLDILNQISDKIKRTQTAQLWLEINFVLLCKKKHISSSNTEVVYQEKLEVVPKNNEIYESNINNEELNYLKNKVKELENKLENIAKNSHKIVANTSNEKIAPLNQDNHESPMIKLSQSKLTLNEINGIWERILVEIKRKSIPAHAILSHGFLADVDQVKKNITVFFESEGYIELLKGKKQRIEQILSPVFGAPYTLISEKGKKSDVKYSDVSKNEKNEVKVSSNIVDFNGAKNNISNNNSSDIENSKDLKKDLKNDNSSNINEISEINTELEVLENKIEVTQDSASFNLEADKENKVDINNKLTISENNDDKHDNIQDKNFENIELDKNNTSINKNENNISNLSEANIIHIHEEETENHSEKSTEISNNNEFSIKEIMTNYELTEDDHNLNKQEEEKNNDRYFLDVVDIFNGKIIKTS